MYDERNPYNSSQDNAPNGAPKNIDHEFEGVISGAIQEAVNQYHNLLRHGLDIEMQRIVQEFEQATAEIDLTIARRVRARLVEMVQQEVRQVFDDTLGNAEQTLVDPIWAKARDKHLSYITDYSEQSQQWDGDQNSYQSQQASAVGH